MQHHSDVEIAVVKEPELLPRRTRQRSSETWFRSGPRKLDRMKLTDTVGIDIGQNHRLSVRWWRNRLHYHPRVLTLSFEGSSASLQVDDESIRTLFAKALTKFAGLDPLMLRVTLESGSPLLPPLRRLGFLDTRTVFVVGFDVPGILRMSAPLAADAHPRVRLVSLAQALEAVSEEALTALWLEVYGRTARLDPATPHQISTKEQHEMFLGDGELDRSVSVCALEGERLVGICPAYRTNDPLGIELGSVGVGSGSLERHQELSVAMVRSAASRAATTGVRRMSVEVDSDAPWGLYAVADLPGRVVESLVSLMYVPKWSQGARSED